MAERGPVRRIVGVLAAAVLAYAAGAGGWWALLVVGAPAIVAAVGGSALAALVVFGAFRVVAGLPLRDAALVAGGFLAWHVVVWLVFATRAGIDRFVEGPACDGATLGEIYDLSPGCDLSPDGLLLFAVLLLTLPPVGLGVGFALRRLARGRPGA